MSADFESLIDRLAAASLEAKGLLAEVHGAAKDLRAVIRDAATERQRIETMVARAVEDEVEAAVKDEIAQLGAATKKAMDDSVKKVLQEFVKLERAIFTGGVGRAKPGFYGDLRDLVAGNQ